VSDSPVLWWVFGLLIVGMTALDIGVVHRRAREMTLRESFGWTFLWFALAMGFAGAIWGLEGREKALQFTAGYLLEQSLSVDNMFVFVLIFRYFAIEKRHQGRILHWGILGAVVMRLLFIWAGVELISRLHWMTFVFGALLLFTALKLAFQKEEHTDPGKNPALKLLRRFMPVQAEQSGSDFFARRGGVTYATPLFAALFVVEFSDVVFALDSIPAVIAVTRDPFIVYTSNVFAIMGLRSLYFLLAGLIDGLPYLKHGISAILAFVGLKMVLEPWVHVSIAASLSFIAATLAIAAIASLLKVRRRRAR
jgi:tellurite resistance protein TerC